MEEKREMTRHQIHQFVKVDFNREEFLSAEGLNMSARGLLCRLPRALSPGQRIFLMLNMGSAVKPHMLNLDAVIVWTKPDGNQWLGGVEFIDLDSKQESELQEFLASQDACLD